MSSLTSDQNNQKYTHRPPYHEKNKSRLYLEKVMKTELAMALKLKMGYEHRPRYHKDNIAILYLGNRESKHQAIKFKLLRREML